MRIEIEEDFSISVSIVLKNSFPTVVFHVIWSISINRIRSDRGKAVDC